MVWYLGIGEDVVEGGHGGLLWAAHGDGVWHSCPERIYGIRIENTSHLAVKCLGEFIQVHIRRFHAEYGPRRQWGHHTLALNCTLECVAPFHEVAVVDCFNDGLPSRLQLLHIHSAEGTPTHLLQMPEEHWLKAALVCIHRLSLREKFCFVMVRIRVLRRTLLCNFGPFLLEKRGQTHYEGRVVTESKAADIEGFEIPFWRHRHFPFVPPPTESREHMSAHNPW